MRGVRAGLPAAVVGPLSGALVLLLALCWPALAGAGPDEGGGAGTAGAAGERGATGYAGADSLSLTALVDTIPLPPSMPLLISWQRTPKAGLEAEMRLVRYYGELGSSMVLDRGASFTQKLRIATEDHRQLDKTIDSRSGSLEYDDGQSLPIDARVAMSWDWSEDRTVNTAGILNLISRDYKRAAIDLAKADVETGPLATDLFLSGNLEKQQGQTFLQRTDYSNASLGGGVHSRLEPVGGVLVRGLAFERRSDGERVLGEQTSPSRATEDSLGGDLKYEGSLLKGSFAVLHTTMEKSYLDWRRNTTGLVDTARTSTAEKIVDELERSDAIGLKWQNELDLGPVGCRVGLERQLDESSFRASAAGTTERHRDRAGTEAWFKGARDTLSTSYAYEQRWDNQTTRGANKPRGRQIHDQYDFGLDAAHRLFAHTSLGFSYDERLTQDTAQNQFNENDRDRVEQIGIVRLNCDLALPFRTQLIFSTRHVEDLSIRQSRSGNNNIKDTYELAPVYRWRISPWLELQQTYRLAIEYTDYVYDSRDDDYNKRGNLGTRVTLKPSERLSLVVKHDYSERFNATRTSTDATGTDFYHRDLQQTINTIDFAMEYQAADWLALRGATDRTRDEKDTLGRTTTTQDQRSGEVVIGGSANRKSLDGSRVLDATVARYFAYGPSVQRVNKRYWEADVSFSWRF